ncbi:hypothetical protein [Pedobacter sp. R20-19]|uniref:hypothetical protein n=1 Tax=Pedobacter sp. R20-19 TaxID=1270196 RepID=UPI0004938515|nr:hypothetical protein [Pedobacter sp. R20-19]
MINRISINDRNGINNILINLKKQYSIAPNEFTQLLPEVQDALKFLSITVASGILGNRADAWSMNLYYHQKQRLLKWVNAWKLSDEDRRVIDQDENVRILFSQVTSTVADEIFDKKLLLWPIITESLLRNKNFEFNEKQYFIKEFTKLDPFGIDFLAN